MKERPSRPLDRCRAASARNSLVAAAGVPAATLALALALASAPLLPVPHAHLGAQESHERTARQVLERVPLIDGHNDLPWKIRNATDREVAAYDLRRTTEGHTDLARLRDGGVGAQFWSVYVSCADRERGALLTQLEQIDIARDVIDRYPELERVGTASELEDAFARGRIASLLGMEGGHAIENSLAALRDFHRLGVRYMTLTHNCDTEWAEAAIDSDRLGRPVRGLTDFGRELVREMNRLGMLVDLSHTADATMSDALDTSEAPVIWSHASARAVTDHVRNVPDSILRRLPENGGVVMVTFVPAFVSERHRQWSDRETERREACEAEHGADTEGSVRCLEEWREREPMPDALLTDVADHIEHVRDVAGIDHVGIGADYDGITRVVAGLEDVSTYPALLAELSRRGWSEDELEKLVGLNALRVMREAEAVSRRLRATGREPSLATVDGEGR